MAVEYGIVSEPSSYSTATNKWEMGWQFTANENFSVSKLRVKFPAAQTVTANLWSTSRSLLGSVEISAKAGEWTEGELPSKVAVEAGQGYIVSCYNQSTRYYCPSSSLSFNAKLSYVTGRYIKTSGLFPSNSESGQVYPMVDIVIGGSNYAESGFSEYETTCIRNLPEWSCSKISWDADIPDGTALLVYAKLDDGEYAECQSGYSIPSISPGMDLSNSVLKIKVEMSTNDVSITPSLFGISLHFQTSDDEKVIVLNFGSGNTNSIQNAAAPITVAYAGGTLAGAGGPVADFSAQFTATDLLPKNNPHDMEHISLSVQASGVLTEVTYSDTAENEHIEISVTAVGVLTHIDDL